MNRFIIETSVVPLCVILFLSNFILSSDPCVISDGIKKDGESIVTMQAIYDLWSSQKLLAQSLL